MKIVFNEKKKYRTATANALQRELKAGREKKIRMSPSLSLGGNDVTSSNWYRCI